MTQHETATNCQPPLPSDAARAERTFEALAEKRFAAAEHAALLASAFGNSPYLARSAIRESVFLAGLLQTGSRAALNRIVEAIDAVATCGSASDAMAPLRRTKRQAALAIALADISGEWALADVTQALSDFADACVRAGIRLLLKRAASDTEFAHLSPEELERQTGLVVLAMGKHGARELNYSSDIDLVVFYDAERFPFRKRGDARAACVDLVKGLVKLLSETTADGYVFRVDLRLRPDASATQVAISTEAAEAYYESLGQNWERAAMIKARAIAGDPLSAEAFLKAIEPFVWRRNLDYAAIEDIHSIKRQIHAHEGHAEIAVVGHNVKLGRGGIREIEFFVQTQQLILGGRNRALRERRTLEALAALRDRGLVAEETAAELTGAYQFLRKLEHRLQMIEDQQTHTIPDAPEGVAHLACFMGFDSVETFSAAVRRRLETVQQHYARLFERAPDLSGRSGSLVFTGVEDDPETLATLQALGFRDAHHVAHAIRGWHHGRIRATRSPRARELLTKLIPPLLDALAASADPDAAFAQFDRFVSRLSAGVSLFSMLLANPQLLQLIANICGSAPRFADHLASSPKVLDALLDPDFIGGVPDRASLRANLAAQLAAADDYEGKLDATRRFAREANFRVGVQVVEGTVDSAAAGAAFTDIAEAVTADMIPAVEEELARQAGHIAGGDFAVVAMGKLGGREMTATSDLDLIFVYDAPPSVEHSDAANPLPVPVYYGRLAQRLIAALTAHTTEGGLYEVDMRLRPTGNKGPVAVSLVSFARYHAAEAWTWERMALTRARVLSGSETLRDEIESVIRSALTAPRDPEALKRDVREMRERLAAEFPAKSPWDLKFARGGLVDLEFIAQYLQLREAPRDASVLDVCTVGALGKLARVGALEPADARHLIEAVQIQQTLQQVLRVALSSSGDAAAAAPGLKSLLARATGESDFASLDARLSKLQQAARVVFECLLCS
ncbi:MAG TPA: bifunctional [glutamine synthetase] adenylyltransferase/[glutamine synthetase]-adenylyl-L-tyrosine phosphorylase [Rhizomicrobium sp.]|jgi:glutamate-ammonia-ligase adenylyltransferase